MKKILTLNDLMSFCKSNKLQRFSSKDTGYQLCVHTSADFELDDENDVSSDSMFFGKLRSFHIGKNRNGSFVPKESAEKAMATMKYKPVLAHIQNFGSDEEEDYDFTSHEIEIDKKGNLVYIEKQVGSITSDQPWFWYDEKNDKTYIMAYAAIPRYYTRAADIIEAKGGTKVSVELLIDEMSWNGDEGALSLDDFEVQGVTLLGRSIDSSNYGTPVEEGMEGARLDLEDFKEDNNSVVRFSNEENAKLIETLDKLNETLSNISIYNYSRKEENLMDVNKELNAVADENQTVENVPETVTMEENSSENVAEENVAEEETQRVAEADNAEAEQFEQNENQTTTESEPVVSEFVEDNSNGESDDASSNEDPSTPDETFANNENATTEDNGTRKFTFELSHDDIRLALYDLIYATYPEEYLFINTVYNNYFIMEDWDTCKYYKQEYTNDGTNIALNGDRVEVFAEFLTASERDALDLMRNTYESMQTELNSYKAKEVLQEKHARVIDNSDYDVIKDTDEFKALVADVDNYSVEDFCIKADLLLAKFAKGNVNTFAKKESNTNETRFFGFYSENKTKTSEKNKPYGGIFEDFFNNKN